MKTKMLGILLLSVACVFANAHAGGDATASPQASAQMVPAAELKFGAVTGEPEGLSSQQVTDLKSGAVFKVYFDDASVDVAKRSVPVLAAFYREIAPLVAMRPDAVDWSSVLFARNADDLVLTRKVEETLWRVNVAADGELGPDGIKTLYVTIPHEQTHATQEDHGLMGLPRWFSEGQASWVESRIADRWKPELARDRREQLTAAVASAKQPLALGQWGGFQPKPEAILRQLTPEQRAQVEKDPTSLPPGPYTFTEADYTQDESNTLARYGGSLALFERIDQQAGREALQAWFKAVREAGPKMTNDKLTELALQHTKVDITADLK